MRMYVWDDVRNLLVKYVVEKLGGSDQSHVLVGMGEANCASRRATSTEHS